VCIDVGTNNEELLDDPLYIGQRKPRVTGDEYDDLMVRRRTQTPRDTRVESVVAVCRTPGGSQSGMTQAQD